MPLIFGKNETTAGKIVAIFVLLFLALAIYGLINRGNFTPSPDITLIAGPVSTAFGLVTTIYYYNNPQPDSKFSRLNTITKIFLFPIFAAFMFGIYWAALSWGIPLMHTVLAGAPARIEVTVVNRFPERDGKGCHYRIGIASSKIRPDGNTCVSQEIWSNAKPGDRLIVDIRIGTLGTAIAKIHEQ